MFFTNFIVTCDESNEPLIEAALHAESRTEISGIIQNLSDHQFVRIYGPVRGLRGSADVELPKIKEVIYHSPATIVYWKDGTKTVVKCASYDTFDKEKGLAMAIIKKLCGNDYSFHKLFKKYAED